jgi:hypothetical protein
MGFEVLFNGSSITVRQAPDYFGNAAALSRLGKCKCTFNGRRHRHRYCIAQAVG